jgi:hypothetical protein
MTFPYAKLPYAVQGLPVCRRDHPLNDSEFRFRLSRGIVAICWLEARRK